MSVDEAFEMYETAVDKLLEKSDGLLLSLVLNTGGYKTSVNHNHG
jgi:hypothetical protein